MALASRTRLIVVGRRCARALDAATISWNAVAGVTGFVVGIDEPVGVRLAALAVSRRLCVDGGT